MASFSKKINKDKQTIINKGITIQLSLAADKRTAEITPFRVISTM